MASDSLYRQNRHLKHVASLKEHFARKFCHIQIDTERQYLQPLSAVKLLNPIETGCAIHSSV